MTEPGALGPSGLHHLLAWASPAFPVGAFSYSHGLDWSVSAGDVRDRATLVGWLEDLLRYGAGRNDAILAAAAWRAVRAHDQAALAETAALAAALSPSAERRLETVAQGNAFRDTVRAAWPAPALGMIARDKITDIAYPAAFGAAAAAHGVAITMTLNALVHAFVANLISAAVRLVPLGQTDGQLALRALGPLIDEVAADARPGKLDEIGGAVWRADIASMAHETQYTRLFRS